MPGVIEVYRKTKKAHDLFWNRFVCRPVAAVLVAAVAGTRITPNQITLAAFVVAAGSAAIMIAVPGYWGLLGAVVVFELSYVLDCADGMLARWRQTASTTGHLLDFLMDEIKALMVLAAVAVRLYLESSNDRWLLIGVGGLVCLAAGIAITTFQRRPEVVDERETASVPAAAGSGARALIRSAVGLVERFAKLLIHYPSYILIVGALGRIDLYLYVYVGVNAVYALRALASVAWRFGRA